MYVTLFTTYRVCWFSFVQTDSCVEQTGRQPVNCVSTAFPRWCVKCSRGQRSEVGGFGVFGSSGEKCEKSNTHIVYTVTHRHARTDIHTCKHTLIHIWTGVIRCVNECVCHSREQSGGTTGRQHQRCQTFAAFSFTNGGFAAFSLFYIHVNLILFDFGTVAHKNRHLKMPEGSIKFYFAKGLINCMVLALFLVYAYFWLCTIVYIIYSVFVDMMTAPEGPV